MLQHRGQDAAGMVVCNETGELNSRKSMGYVRDVFQQSHMNKLNGNYGIGHVRYPTAGGAGKEFSQPMYVNSPYGISLAHNGNLTNSRTLTKELFHDEMRRLNTDSDSEVLLNIFAQELGKHREINPTPEHVFEAVTETHKRCDGAYAVIALISASHSAPAIFLSAAPVSTPINVPTTIGILAPRTASTISNLAAANVRTNRSLPM